MNDQVVPTMSRRQRHVEAAQQGHPKKNTNAKNHGGLVVILVLLSLFLLASAPVYGLMKNAPKMTKTTTSSTSSSTSAASSSSATATSQSQSAASSQSQSATSQAQQSSDDQAASQAALANTAVLATGQTLYNFAVTHGTTADQIYNLNPGITAQNYTQYAGQSLKIK